ncbi:MAG: hemin uptake protein HemP [Planctomycetales bacterium]
MTHDPADPVPGPNVLPEGAAPPRTLDSANLLQGRREVLIQHGPETYRLRLTRNGKLILHK